VTADGSSRTTNAEQDAIQNRAARFLRIDSLSAFIVRLFR
jgi:hypothetical protein